MSNADPEHRPRARNFDQLSTEDVDELIPKELDEVMLGRRSDAIRIKLARRAFGPLLIHQISPAALHLQSQIVDFQRQGLIGAGEWSKSRPLSQSTVHQLMNQLVQYGRAYRDMPIYGKLLERASLGKPRVSHGVALDSRAIIDAYCERYLQLIESIRRYGLLPLDEVARSTVDPLVQLSGALAEKEKNVEIAIGPNGELLRLGTGRHRMAIAQALGLERMSVEIRLIHAEWLSKLIAAPGKSPLIALRDWLKAANQHGLGS